MNPRATQRCRRSLHLLGWMWLVVVGAAKGTSATDLLVADRITHNVYRYDSEGTFLNVVLDDNSHIQEAVGLTLSPDQTQLYVSSAQNNRVMRYDYDVATGTATNATIFAEGPEDGLFFPNSILFSEDGDRIYVSNWQEAIVSQFDLVGNNAGPPITGEIGVRWLPDIEMNSTIASFSGLAFAPTGELFVGGWAGFPDASYGAIGITDSAISTLTDFTGAIDQISGASGLMVVDDEYLYVSGMLSHQIRRIDLATGSLDEDFVISEVPFPQNLVPLPDGNGFLVGVLGDMAGTGRIDHYAFDGTFMGTFATIGEGGFQEATAFLFVRDPNPVLPGDFNGDGNVNLADYTVWRDLLGSSSTLNGNGDEVGPSANLVDAADYTLWKNHFGEALSSSVGITTSTVPEPSTLLLAALAAFSFPAGKAWYKRGLT